MAEPTRTANAASRRSQERGAGSTAYPLDVLLIADEPRKSRLGSDGRGQQEGAAVQDEGTRPLDMESVVRRLIAILSEEPLP